MAIDKKKIIKDNVVKTIPSKDSRFDINPNYIIPDKKGNIPFARPEQPIQAPQIKGDWYDRVANSRINGVNQMGKGGPYSLRRLDDEAKLEKQSVQGIIRKPGYDSQFNGPWAPLGGQVKPIGTPIEPIYNPIPFRKRMADTPAEDKTQKVSTSANMGKFAPGINLVNQERNILKKHTGKGGMGVSPFSQASRPIDLLLMQGEPPIAKKVPNTKNNYTGNKLTK